MFCPNCGAKNGKKQNYCRFCGLFLQDVAKSLASQLVFGVDSDLVKSLSSVKRILDLTIAAVAGMVIISAAAYFFFGSGFGKDAIKAGAVIFLLLQALMGAVGYYQRKKRSDSKKTNKFEPNTIEQFETKETNKLLEEKPFQPAAVVAENSTELFPIENKTHKFE